jgi:hypothetical protein
LPSTANNRRDEQTMYTMIAYRYWKPHAQSAKYCQTASARKDRKRAGVD